MCIPVSIFIEGKYECPSVHFKNTLNGRPEMEYPISPDTKQCYDYTDYVLDQDDHVPI